MERRHPAASCEECPLFTPENKFVPTQFAPNTKVVVVGEAPGFQEAAYGRPFAGPSGQLIRKVMHHHGFKKDEVTYTNACLCRPPNNATPPKGAVNACRGRLLAEIASTRSRSVVALGNTAAAALIDDTRTISSLRVGPAKSPTRALGDSNVENVVPTWHPAYCLRTADAFPSLVNDIGKLKESRREPWRDPQWEATDDPVRALAIINKLLLGKGPLVIDIEVGIEKDTGYDHPNEYDLLCVGISDSAKQAFVLGSGGLAFRDVLDALRRLLRARPIIAHNGKFDLAGLYPTLGGLTLWFDTMLASYALDERPGIHSLEYLGVEKVGTPNWKNEIKKYIPRRGNYADIPRPILYKYNALDVAATYALYELFSEALGIKELRRVHDHLVAASNQLMYLELNGVPVDIPYNFELGNAYQERIQALEREIDRIVRDSTDGQIEAINPRSPKQIKDYLADQGVLVAATDVDTLNLLLGRLARDSPTADFVLALLKHRREQKLYSTYVEGIRKRVYRHRVYTTYLLHGTTSGRLASRNPNLQNIVRDTSIRRQFVASKPEHILVQADYKNAELRVMAHESDDRYLLEVLSQSEIDLFNSLADQIYGPGRWTKEVERVRIKAFVYGLAYGREAPSIAAEFKMPLREAYNLRDRFLALIPGIVAWQDKIKTHVLSGGDLVTWFGRRRRFHLITDQNRREVLNEALSYVPQSTASDICLAALTRVRPLLRGLGFVRLTIHDAIVAECHSDRRDEVSSLLQSVMEEEGRRYTTKVPFYTDVSFGPSWGDL